MKKLLLVMTLLIAPILVMAGSPYDYIGIHRGNNGITYTCFIATTPYCVILSTDANIMTDVNIENTGSEDAYYDFDVSVSTGQRFSPSASQLLNGYRTGANAVLRVGKDRSFEGKCGSVVYFRTPTATGTTISITMTQSQPN